MFGWQADQSGCGSYRIKYPFRALQERGWQADYGIRLKRDNLRNYEVLVAQRVGNPRTPALLDAAKQAGIQVVIEHDDDLFNVPPKNPAAAIFTQPHIRQGMADCLRRANLITASTPHLADRLAEFERPVLVLPNSIPDHVFDLPLHKFSHSSGNDADDAVVLGWRGSPTHAEDFHEAVHGLNRVLQNPNVFLQIIGSKPTDKLPDAQVMYNGWIKNLDDFYSALAFDIGVIPLADNVFNQSKSHIAALEMAARGIPVVASDSPAYRDFVIHGSTGFLVKQRHEWAKYLNILIKDPDLRHLMGQHARERAELYRTSVIADQYAHAYGSLIMERWQAA